MFLINFWQCEDYVLMKKKTVSNNLIATSHCGLMKIIKNDA